jgi:hypothetical protein
MDWNRLQHKLFQLDPVDPREDLAKLRAQAQGSVPVKTETVDYINESVRVPEGSLQMDRNYSVNDFAALAGVVVEKKQKNADQVRGNEPMPKAKPGRTEHPFKDRLVGEEDKDERIAKLEERVARLESLLSEKQKTPAKKLPETSSIKEELWAKLNKKMGI